MSWLVNLLTSTPTISTPALSLAQLAYDWEERPDDFAFAGDLIDQVQSYWKASNKDIDLTPILDPIHHILILSIAKSHFPLIRSTISLIEALLRPLTTLIDFPQDYQQFTFNQYNIAKFWCDNAHSFPTLFDLQHMNSPSSTTPNSPSLTAQSLGFELLPIFNSTITILTTLFRANTLNAVFFAHHRQHKAQDIASPSKFMKPRQTNNEAEDKASHHHSTLQQPGHKPDQNRSDSEGNSTTQLDVNQREVLTENSTEGRETFDSASPTRHNQLFAFPITTEAILQHFTFHHAHFLVSIINSRHISQFSASPTDQSTTLSFLNQLNSDLPDFFGEVLYESVISLILSLVYHDLPSPTIQSVLNSINASSSLAVHHSTPTPTNQPKATTAGQTNTSNLTQKDHHILSDAIFNVVPGNLGFHQSPTATKPYLTAIIFLVQNGLIHSFFDTILSQLSAFNHIQDEFHNYTLNLLQTAQNNAQPPIHQLEDVLDKVHNEFNPQHVRALPSPDQLNFAFNLLHCVGTIFNSTPFAVQSYFSYTPRLHHDCHPASNNADQNKAQLSPHTLHHLSQFSLLLRANNDLVYSLYLNFPTAYLPLNLFPTSFTPPLPYPSNLSLLDSTLTTHLRTHVSLSLLTISTTLDLITSTSSAIFSISSLTDTGIAPFATYHSQSSLQITHSQFIPGLIRLATNPFVSTILRLNSASILTSLLQNNHKNIAFTLSLKVPLPPFQNISPSGPKSLQSALASYISASPTRPAGFDPDQDNKLPTIDITNEMHFAKMENALHSYRTILSQDFTISTPNALSQLVDPFSPFLCNQAWEKSQSSQQLNPSQLSPQNPHQTAPHPQNNAQLTTKKANTVRLVPILPFLIASVVDQNNAIYQRYVPSLETLQSFEESLKWYSSSPHLSSNNNNNNTQHANHQSQNNSHLVAQQSEPNSTQTPPYHLTTALSPPLLTLFYYHSTISNHRILFQSYSTILSTFFSTYSPTPSPLHLSLGYSSLHLSTPQKVSFIEAYLNSLSTSQTAATSTNMLSPMSSTPLPTSSQHGFTAFNQVFNQAFKYCDLGRVLIIAMCSSSITPQKTPKIPINPSSSTTGTPAVLSPSTATATATATSVNQDATAKHAEEVQKKLAQREAKEKKEQEESAMFLQYIGDFSLPSSTILLTARILRSSFIPILPTLQVYSELPKTTHNVTSEDQPLNPSLFPDIQPLFQQCFELQQTCQFLLKVIFDRNIDNADDLMLLLFTSQIPLNDEEYSWVTKTLIHNGMYGLQQENPVKIIDKLNQHFGFLYLTPNSPFLSVSKYLKASSNREVTGPGGNVDDFEEKPQSYSFFVIFMAQMLYFIKEVQYISRIYQQHLVPTQSSHHNPPQSTTPPFSLAQTHHLLHLYNSILSILFNIFSELIRTSPFLTAFLISSLFPQNQQNPQESTQHGQTPTQHAHNMLKTHFLGHITSLLIPELTQVFILPYSTAQCDITSLTSQYNGIPDGKSTPHHRTHLTQPSSSVLFSPAHTLAGPNDRTKENGKITRADKLGQNVFSPSFPLDQSHLNTTILERFNRYPYHPPTLSPTSLPPLSPQSSQSSHPSSNSPQSLIFFTPLTYSLLIYLFSIVTEQSTAIVSTQLNLIKKTLPSALTISNSQSASNTQSSIKQDGNHPSHSYPNSPTSFPALSTTQHRQNIRIVLSIGNERTQFATTLSFKSLNQDQNVTAQTSPDHFDTASQTTHLRNQQQTPYPSDPKAENGDIISSHKPKLVFSPELFALLLHFSSHVIELGKAVKIEEKIEWLAFLSSVHTTEPTFALSYATNKTHHSQSDPPRGYQIMVQNQHPSSQPHVISRKSSSAMPAPPTESAVERKGGDSAVSEQLSPHPALPAEPGSDELSLNDFNDASTSVSRTPSSHQPVQPPPLRSPQLLETTTPVKQRPTQSLKNLTSPTPAAFDPFSHNPSAHHTMLNNSENTISQGIFGLSQIHPLHNFAHFAPILARILPQYQSIYINSFDEYNRETGQAQRSAYLQNAQYLHQLTHNPQSIPSSAHISSNSNQQDEFDSTFQLQNDYLYEVIDLDGTGREQSETDPKITKAGNPSHNSRSRNTHSAQHYYKNQSRYEMIFEHRLLTTVTSTTLPFHVHCIANQLTKNMTIALAQLSVFVSLYHSVFAQSSLSPIALRSGQHRNNEQSRLSNRGQSGSPPDPQLQQELTGKINEIQSLKQQIAQLEDQLQNAPHVHKPSQPVAQPSLVCPNCTTQTQLLEHQYKQYQQRLSALVLQLQREQKKSLLLSTQLTQFLHLLGHVLPNTSTIQSTEDSQTPSATTSRTQTNTLLAQIQTVTGSTNSTPTIPANVHLYPPNQLPLNLDGKSLEQYLRQHIDALNLALIDIAQSTATLSHNELHPPNQQDSTQLHSSPTPAVNQVQLDELKTAHKAIAEQYNQLLTAYNELSSHYAVLSQQKSRESEPLNTPAARDQQHPPIELVNTYNELLNVHTQLTNEYNRITQELSTLSEHFNTLTTSHDELAQNFNSLNAQHDELITHFTALNSQHSQLGETYNELLSAHNDLSSNYNQLTTAHNGLGNDYTRLNEAHNDLGGNYNQLNEAYAQLAETYNQLLAVHQHQQPQHPSQPQQQLQPIQEQTEPQVPDSMTSTQLPVDQPLHIAAIELAGLELDHPLVLDSTAMVEVEVDSSINNALLEPAHLHDLVNGEIFDAQLNTEIDLGEVNFEIDDNVQILRENSQLSIENSQLHGIDESSGGFDAAIHLNHIDTEFPPASAQVVPHLVDSSVVQTDLELTNQSEPLCDAITGIDSTQQVHQSDQQHISPDNLGSVSIDHSELELNVDFINDLPAVILDHNTPQQDEHFHDEQTFSPQSQIDGSEALIIDSIHIDNFDPMRSEEPISTLDPAVVELSLDQDPAGLSDQIVHYSPELGSLFEMNIDLNMGSNVDVIQNFGDIGEIGALSDQPPVPIQPHPQQHEPVITLDHLTGIGFENTLNFADLPNLDHFGQFEPTPPVKTPTNPHPQNLIQSVQSNTNIESDNLQLDLNMGTDINFDISLESADLPHHLPLATNNDQHLYQHFSSKSLNLPSHISPELIPTSHSHTNIAPIETTSAQFPPSHPIDDGLNLSHDFDITESFNLALGDAPINDITIISEPIIDPAQELNLVDQNSDSLTFEINFSNTNLGGLDPPQPHVSQPLLTPDTTQEPLILDFNDLNGLNLDQIIAFPSQSDAVDGEGSQVVSIDSPQLSHIHQVQRAPQPDETQFNSQQPLESQHQFDLANVVNDPINLNFDFISGVQLDLQQASSNPAPNVQFPPQEISPAASPITQHQSTHEPAHPNIFDHFADDLNIMEMFSAFDPNQIGDVGFDAQ